VVKVYAPAALPQGNRPWYSLDRRLGGPQSRSGKFEILFNAYCVRKTLYVIILCMLLINPVAYYDAFLLLINPIQHSPS
jgi:hypothetical protein